MRRVTDEDIIQINEAYLLCGTYSGAAKATGWSASTVKKYIISGYTSQTDTAAQESMITLPDLDKVVTNLRQMAHATMLTSEEALEVTELWKELIM